MGLRCSLLGHDFGEAELDRDREERGDEVVITIREVKTCRRCSNDRVLSENTEVRPVEPIEEVESEADAGAPGAAAASGTSGTEDGVAGANAAGNDDGVAGASAAGNDDGVAGANAAGNDDGVAGASAPDDDAEFIDADAGASDTGADAADEPDDRGEVAGVDTATRADPSDGGADAATEDGVIIDDEGEEVEVERSAGEWPDAGDTRMDERDVPAEAGPEVEVESDGEDAEILDGESEPDGEAETEEESETDEEPTEASEPATSDWPDPKGEDRGFDAEPGGDGTDMEFSGIAPEGETGPATTTTTPSESPSMEVDAETAFVCPECGFAKPAANASLRAGDICPECQKGYLGEE